MKVAALTGQACGAALSDVAHLRLQVFRDWPYLYDGDLDYEQSYLRPYAESGRAIIVGARFEGNLVGAATGAPLVEHAAEFGQAFAHADLDLGTVFYCAESVLLPEFRGQGIGHQFFDQREAHARKLGFEHVCFCSVVRAKTHPARPRNYRPLDDFWRGRGYAPMDNVVAQFAWTDLGEDCETTKPMQFWIRAL
ncbi:MAG: GNAT family N-acetyltransferase [Paracoccaceae bacterium]